MNHLSNISDKQSFKDSVKQAMDLRAMEKIQDMKKDIANSVLTTGDQ